ncbi:MAG: hypothetical protein IPO31_24220 [Candidatus Obscuribacter sp.]|nr:hypothetical protein [Candidatus Obscuribacter sp.]
MSNVVTLTPKSTSQMRAPQPDGDGSNVIAFRQINGVETPAGAPTAPIDERPDTVIENIILATATGALNKKDAEEALRCLILEGHRLKLKVMQDDIRLVSPREAEPKLYALIYTIKGPREDVFALEAKLGAIGRSQ